MPKTTTPPPATPVLALPLSLARRAVRYEIGIWRSLARWAARRPDVPRDGTAAAFAYRGPSVAPVLAFFFLSLGEVVAVDLLVPWPWEWLRVLLLAAGCWGTLWMLGLLAAYTVHPHVAGPSGLRVRHGLALDVHIPWDAVSGARRSFGSRDGRGIQLDGDTLYAVHAQQYTVELTLSRPVPATLPRGGDAEFTTLRFHADDAEALVTAVRSRTAPNPPAHR